MVGRSQPDDTGPHYSDVHPAQEQLSRSAEILVSIGNSWSDRNVGAARGNPIQQFSLPSLNLTVARPGT
jgi:hypothetical protein